ncbi:PREDICTED: kinesin-like protein KIF20B [Gavialis gangeticus]|uniref:kinesin-like protein KIF20B n=1 Tax=Gavialis gangeticus TaxID=94835 RepID=UPI00092F14A6|nr:PREDICTED: kinesin-like protein KIF20B [Gavialis gangeticus]
MEPVLDTETIFRPSYIASVELPLRTGPVNVEDIKTNLSDEFSLAASSLNISQPNSFECKEHVQVCLRIRPFTSSEKEQEFQECVSIQDSTSVILKAPKNSMACRLSEKNMGQMMQKFMFSHVFGPETTQEEFFEGTMKQPVQDFLEGHSRLIFTYGVTNAGKTYTFQGTEDDVGILPRTMDMLFKRVHGKMYPEMDLKPHRCRDYIKLTKEQMKEEIAFKNSILRLTKEVDSQNSINSNCSKTSDESVDLEEIIQESEQSITTEGSHVKFSLWVSFCEIYNECIYDLLFPITNDKKRKLLRLAQDIKGCSYVRDLQWVQISNAKEAFRLLKLGLKHQSIACTKLNTCSSRSHSIFTIKILRIEDSEKPLVTQVSELVLCDLAGSERCTKTRNEGDRLKESGNINTSLLILGKCINALKNSQQSKLQQHIPFRESKLTHFLQGFFNGRGKVHMIVNISQCASAYDETLNVLKFSAVAQKILVLDSYNPPQEQSFGQKSVREAPFVSDTNTKMQVARKRATIFWDRSLEDVMEDDDCIMHDNETQAEEEMVKEMPKAEEERDKSVEMPKEKMEDHEGSEIVIGKEEYLRLLNIIEDLKNKLISERKDKLLLELKIREEVTQEFTQYFAQQGNDFRVALNRERELLEETSEKRLEIYKDLVNEYVKIPDEGEKIKDAPSNEQAATLEEGNNVVPKSCIYLEGIINSLENDVTDIKKQAEEVHSYIVSLQDPQEAIAWLEKQFKEVTTELTKTKEELTQRTKELNIQVAKLSEYTQQLNETTEKMTTKNKQIQELIHITEQKDDVIAKLQDLISHLEATLKNYDSDVTTIKKEIAKENINKRIQDVELSELVENVLEVGRKRRSENKLTQEEEPPTKRGTVSTTVQQGALQKNMTSKPEQKQKIVARRFYRLRKRKSVVSNTKWKLYGCIQNKCKDDAIEQSMLKELKQNISEKDAEMLALKERYENLECQLTALKEELKNEKTEKEGISEQMAGLHLQLSRKEEKVFSLSEELQQSQANYEKIVFELEVQKGINKEQEKKIKQMTVEIETTSQNIREKASQIKTMQSKMEEVCKLDLESHTVDVDLVNLRDFLEYSPKNTPEKTQMHSLCLDLHVSNTPDLGQESSFYCSVEGIWEECRKIIEISSQKSHKIKELLQQVEYLQKQVSDAGNENSQLKLKLNEITNQGNLFLKEKDILVDQLREQLQENTLDSEKHIVERCRTITCLEKQISDYKTKIKELESLLEVYRAKDDNAATLKNMLKKKDSVILKIESNVRDLEEKCKNSDKKIKELNDQEIKLKEEVLQLKDNLKTTEQSLQEKKREDERKKEATEQLSKDLSESSSVIQHLNVDLQRKDEEYADLKEKLADAKKQIQQVQKEVCTMRSEENSLRNKVNELEKTKNRLVDELDIKQRTIQQLKEQLNNEKMEEILKQYDNACKDLCAKKKIIEDMRLTLKEQEETQMEQDQVLEAKLEENKRLVSELEEWKQKYKELEKQSSGNQQIISKYEEESIDVRGEQIKLQERLKESEEKYKADRKKWLEEKMELITQVKEAENNRNKEMRRFAEDRERYVNQQTEMERLTAQLAEKDNNLQKWREEKDQVVKALEVQLKTLSFNNVQKDKEIEELKQTTLKGSGKEYEIAIEQLRRELAERHDLINKLKQPTCEYEIAIEQLRRELAERHDLINKLKQPTCHENPKSGRVSFVPKQRLSKIDESSHSQQKKEGNNRVTGQCVPVKENEVKEKSLLHCTSNTSSLNEIEDHSDTVLDSSEVSTENGQTSRFPKPEMEIKFTPLQPNKMEVKHQGSALPVTVKMSKARRKRKSDEMDEDSVKQVNKKNTTSMTNNWLPTSSNSATINKMKMVSNSQSFRKEYPLRNQQSTASMKSTRKKDGTLQKLGDFLQSSPTIIHSKAKKLIKTISSPKSAQMENHKENQLKPKQTKRRLYSAAISSPLDIPGHVIVLDQKKKESDHLIMKRRLRTKTAK